MSDHEHEHEWIPVKPVDFQGRPTDSLRYQGREVLLSRCSCGARKVDHGNGTYWISIVEAAQ